MNLSCIYLNIYHMYKKCKKKRLTGKMLLAKTSVCMLFTYSMIYSFGISWLRCDAGRSKVVNDLMK